MYCIPVPDLHRPGDLGVSLKRHQVASGVCRPHELSTPVRLDARQQHTKQRACVAADLARRCTLFNTPPHPRPLTPPQGWRQGSIKYRSLAPCSLPLLGSLGKQPPLPSCGRSHRAASLIKIHKRPVRLPRLDGVSAFLHRALISSPSSAWGKRLKDSFPPTSLPADRLTRSACPPWLATAQADAFAGSPGRARLDPASPVCFASLPFPLSFYKKIHKAAASLPRLDGVSVWQPRRLISSPSSAWGKKLKDSFPSTSQPADCFTRSACPPWLATARADALTGSPGRARLDLASPVCFASLPFLISFYKKTHKRPVRLPLHLIGSAFLHRALIFLIGCANKNLRFIFFSINYQPSTINWNFP
jgi:hypothetical protein